MPGYVSYVSGVAGRGSTTTLVRSRTMLSATLFVAGFAITFTLMGAAASWLGSLIPYHRLVLGRIAGVFVILMGFATMGLLRVPFLYRERRLDLARIRPGPAGALPLGMAFAIGWTPCIGRVLAAILTAAAAAEGVWRGAALLFVYSLGLGVPFLLLAFAVARTGRLFGWIRRHGRTIELAGGGVLILMGVLMITGRWVQLFALSFGSSRGALGLRYETALACRPPRRRVLGDAGGRVGARGVHLFDPRAGKRAERCTRSGGAPLLRAAQHQAVESDGDDAGWDRGQGERHGAPKR